MIIILDVDETLIHSSTEPIDNGNKYVILNSFYVYLRPQVIEFLSLLSYDSDYILAIWSAGSYEYVHSIIEYLFKGLPPPIWIMTRNNCDKDINKPLSFAVKNHNKLYPNYPISINDLLLIDDRDNVTKFNELNHLTIREYEGEKYDNELIKLYEFLDENRDKTAAELSTLWIK